MFKDTGAVDAASILFNLEDYRVLSVETSTAGRTVVVEPLSTEAGCPSCGVLSSRIQARPVHRVKDVACGGKDLQVLVRKRRLACREAACTRRSFVQCTEQLPLRSRLTTRLVGEIVDAGMNELRAVTGIARASGVSWPTVMRKLTATEKTVGDVDARHVRWLGVDEHRFRKVRYVLGTTGKVMRVEPWSIVFTETGNRHDPGRCRWPARAHGALLDRKEAPSLEGPGEDRGDGHVSRVPQGGPRGAA
ncbi:hypothetical protein GCM10023166_00070 [Paeniglutamicibacter cryotolerans]|uniref:Transposase IS204/IS1001/IS1096/IS1165 zinc-finger domain-containing protein n=1 Tax=Paeniglutamicibacter cryotolerans TaxID=670079 RepID=A0A839QH62_9MICC|nr:hypothetical protein [Paeniglutamicibacter cryotolerans]